MCIHICISRSHLYTTFLALNVIQTPSLISVLHIKLRLWCVFPWVLEALSSFWLLATIAISSWLLILKGLKNYTWHETGHCSFFFSCVPMLCVVYMPAQAKGQPLVSFIPQAQSFFFFGQDFLKRGWAGCLASPRNPPASYSPELGLQVGATRSAFFFMGPSNWT